MRIIRYHQLRPEKGISFSREHRRRLMAVGLFPKHFAIGDGQHIGWLEAEIDGYISERAARRHSVEVA